MICTSSHNNWQSDKFKTYAISGNRGKDVNYHGYGYPKLAPKLSFGKYGMIISVKFLRKKIINIMLRSIGIKYYRN